MSNKDEKRLGEAIEQMSEAIFANAAATQELARAIAAQRMVAATTNGATKASEQLIEEPDEIPIDM